LVVLPSKQLRFIPNQGYVALGGSQPTTRRFFVTPNAGFNRRLGRRPVVRGTVRNPNDHPHGGRTRAIKYPRTPWGKTAKFSRPPRPVTKLKVLAKRRREPGLQFDPYWARKESQPIPM